MIKKILLGVVVFVVVIIAVSLVVVALQPELIMLADDGGVTIDASTEASLQMDSAPDSPAVATTVLVSMFHMNTVALRAERFITWKKANANGCVSGCSGKRNRRVSYRIRASSPFTTSPKRAGWPISSWSW